MTTLNTVHLAVLGLVFLVWVVAMFRMLWRLTRRSMERLDETGGGYFTWMGHSLRAFRGFLTSEEDRRERRRLLLLTAVLFAFVVLGPVMVAISAG